MDTYALQGSFHPKVTPWFKAMTCLWRKWHAPNNKDGWIAPRKKFVLHLWLHFPKFKEMMLSLGEEVIMGPEIINHSRKEHLASLVLDHFVKYVYERFGMTEEEVLSFDFMSFLSNPVNYPPGIPVWLKPDVKKVNSRR